MFFSTLVAPQGTPEDGECLEGPSRVRGGFGVWTDPLRGVVGGPGLPRGPDDYQGCACRSPGGNDKILRPARAKWWGGGTAWGGNWWGGERLRQLPFPPRLGTTKDN